MEKRQFRIAPTCFAFLPRWGTTSGTGLGRPKEWGSCQLENFLIKQTGGLRSVMRNVNKPATFLEGVKPAHVPRGRPCNLRWSKLSQVAKLGERANDASGGCREPRIGGFLALLIHAIAQKDVDGRISCFSWKNASLYPLSCFYLLRLNWTEKALKMWKLEREIKITSL